MPRMETKWLEDFVSLAETRSFSRSAQLRHVTQPAFSRRIQALEAWAGTDLVDRSSYPTRLTPAGKTLYDQALEMLQGLHNTRAMLRAHTSSGKDVVAFAVPHTLAFTFFPAWVSELHAQFGPFKSRLIALNVHDAVMRLVEGGCDLLIAVGVRFSDRALGNAATFAAQAKVLHIDIDRAEINKNVSTTLHITGDARVVLDLLLPRVEQKDSTQWMQQARSMMEEYLSDELFEPRKILRQMAAITPEITVATDVGQHQMWTAQHFPFLHPRQLITSGGLGTMGFGLGAAMGAAASDPQGKPVALITGDGSFRMNLTELSTIGYYNIPVIVVIFNNGTLGMVRQWQTLFFGHRYSQTTLDRGPDFMKLAAAYGLSGARVDTVEAFAAAFKAAIEKREPCIIECMLDIDEMVAPMVAPGSPIDSFCLN